MRRPSSQKYAPVSISHDQGEGFIATGTPVGTLSPESNSYLEVVAPAKLSEGETFEAQVNGKTFTVKVPMGGVQEGEKISVPFDSGLSGYPGISVPCSSIPVGHWKDGLCACCGLGCFHPVLWNAWCCPFILLGQVMYRLKLTWLANQGGSAAETAATFRILFWIGIVSWVISFSLPYLPHVLTYDEGQLSDGYFFLYFMVNAVILVIAVLRIVLICKTRAHIRKKYQIPAQQCICCEDFCCAFWFSCCTAAQMARHTGEYDVYQGMCYSETGLPPHAPSIV